MKKRLFLFCLTGILISGACLAQNWPQFGGMERDGKVTGFKAPASWPSQLEQQWKITIGSGDATPVLVGKSIYTHTRQGDEEIIRCIDVATGKEIWKSSYPAPVVTGPSASHPGPRSSPAEASGRLVTFGVSGILSCLDATTGNVIWRKDNPEGLVPQFYTGMSPLVVDNTCIVYTGTKENGAVQALDLSNGNLKWEWKGEGPSYASPKVMNMESGKLIIVQSEKNLLALNSADGKLVWQIATPPQQRFYNAASPYIYRDIIYYTGQGLGMKAVKVVQNGGNFTTQELWVNPEIGGKWNTPVLHDGYLYGFTDQKRIYCINAANGEKAWVDEAVNSDFAGIVDCGSVIIGLPSTGNLIVLKPDPGSYSELAKYKLAETPVYSYPLVSGNMIYVKDAENLTGYMIK